MPNVLEVAENIYRIQVKLPTLAFACTAYLINDGGGVVVDPGPSAAVPPLLDGMKQLGMKGLEYVIPTHVHVDHGGAAGSLARIFPGASVVAHPSARDHLLDPSRLIESTKRTYGEQFENEIGAILRVPESQMILPGDGEILHPEGRPLKVLYSPGHAPHHIAILDLKTNGLFCGEALGMRAKSAKLKPMPNTAPPAFDTDVYIDTINKLRSLGPKALFYAHDGVSRDREEIEVLFSEIAQNTSRMNNIVLNQLQKGGSQIDIAAALADFMTRDLGVDPAEVDLKTTAIGFMIYFKRKGLSGGGPN